MCFAHALLSIITDHSILATVCFHPPFKQTILPLNDLFELRISCLDLLTCLMRRRSIFSCLLFIMYPIIRFSMSNRFIHLTYNKCIRPYLVMIIYISYSLQSCTIYVIKIILFACNIIYVFLLSQYCIYKHVLKMNICKN